MQIYLNIKKEVSDYYQICSSILKLDGSSSIKNWKINSDVSSSLTLTYP